MIALVEGWRAGLLARNAWTRNVVAGLVVGVVALPLAMAFAIASGVRPEQGIYTAIVAGLIVSLCGGSRLQIAGPTGAFVVILASITAQYGIAGLQLATLMAGCMLLLMGVSRLGAVIKFIPAPVIIGFTSGIGVIIFVGQWRDFLGLPQVNGAHFHEKLLQLVASLPQTDPSTAMLGVFSLVIVVGAPRIKWLSRIPGPLIAMLAATAVHYALQSPSVATIGSTFGALPVGLPTFHWPEFTLADVLQLVGPAFTIAMLGAIESLLSAVVADGMAGTHHDSNQELIGQGIANIAAPLFGGFAATGAIARTATNIRNGATGPIAGITHALFLVLVLLFLAPLAVHIPLAALAAILFVVAWNMSEVGHFAYVLRRAPQADKVILVTTFLLTVFADLVVAVNVGVILAVLQFMRRMSDSVDTQQVDEQSLAATLRELGRTTLPDGVVVFQIDGPVFFGAVDKFKRAMLDIHAMPQVLILRLLHVPFMDLTGIQSLDEVIATLARRKVQTILCEANPRVRGKLEAARVIRLGDPAWSGAQYMETLVSALQQAGSPAAPRAH